jgi:ATP-dependent DNA helicase RecG
MGAPLGRRLAQLEKIPVAELRSVGSRRAERLAAMGIVSVLDLLTHYPRRYEDFTACLPIEALREGDEVSVVAWVRRVVRRRARSGRSLVEVVLEDETGRLSCTFFNQPWRSNQVQDGALVVVSGKVGAYRGALQMANPTLRLAPVGAEGQRVGRVVAVYPESERAKIASASLARFAAEALERAGAFADPLPEPWRRRLGLLGRTEALWAIHRPASIAEANKARRRLAFDELFRLQLALVLRKRAVEREALGISHDVRPRSPEDDLVRRFLAGLPFSLTAAQRRVLCEIETDMASPVPMHRLLQGDVGAGKTVVAFAALLFAVQGGHQGVLMAPTEVLAEQHFAAARSMLAHLDLADPARLGGRRPLGVELLTSRTPSGERERLRDERGRLQPDIVVGTHALLGEGVRFRSLGAVVIDEQHRFGVDQRAYLAEQKARSVRGRDPDLLVMTATPIPRTAAMTVYGDLDSSILDELPPGRVGVRTKWVRDAKDEAAVWAHVRAEVAKGHQAYVVCPLVGDGEEAQDDGEEGDEEGPARLRGAAPARSAIAEAARLGAGELSAVRVGLLHGRLSASEKQAVMASFRDGALDVLVATTVIEVGVDVPSATVMVVEDADRFGIAQLHQLRGRVGRGGQPSACYLLAASANEEAARRLEALEATTDGFELAEIDLELRGEGTVLGARQKGRSDMKLASLARHRDLVRAARKVAESLVDEDPSLASHPLLAEELQLFVGEEEGYLFRS